MATKSMGAGTGRRENVNTVEENELCISSNRL